MASAPVYYTKYREGSAALTVLASGLGAIDATNGKGLFVAGASGSRIRAINVKISYGNGAYNSGGADVFAMLAPPLHVQVVKTVTSPSGASPFTYVCSIPIGAEFTQRTVIFDDGKFDVGQVMHRPRLYVDTNYTTIWVQASGAEMGSAVSFSCDGFDA